MPKFTCSVKGCQFRRRQNWHLTCEVCWRKVPRQTQLLFYRIYMTGQYGSETYVQTCKRILDLLNNEDSHAGAS